MEQAETYNPSPVRSPSFDELRRHSNLTNNQIGFWLGQMVSPSSSIYNMGQVYHLSFELDPEIFRGAFKELVHRSDALRTTFAATGGVPRQIVADSLDYVVPVVDLSGHDSPENELRRWCDRRISLPMNLTEACFDTVLLRLNPSQWAWYFCIHHLIGDGTSVELIFQYVGRLYAEAVGGGRGDLQDLPKFASYVQQEKEYRDSAQCRRDAAFWAARGRAPSPLVPFYGNSRKDENLCVRSSRVLERSQTDRLLQVASETLGVGISADLNALAAYLAILAAYLLRTSGADRLVAGTPFHNRASRKDKQVLGLMMELVVLGLDVSPEDSFSSLLSRAKSEIQTVLRHYRFGMTNSTRDRNYDVMLNLLPSSTDTFAGEPVRTEWVHSGEWNECLTVQVQRTTQGDKIYFDMNREVFRGRLAENAPEHFMSLLNALVNDPHRAIRDADLLTSAERNVLDQKLRNTGRRVAADETIVSHFQAVADRNPQAAAVVQGERVIDYRTLDRMSNRLSAFLCAHGVSKGEHVGVCMDRSIERIAVILGILKAGAAYVPVDEAWPCSRLQMTMEDASVRRIVTQSANMKLLTDATSGELLDVDTLAEEISRQSDGRSTVRAHCNDTAYINFTSGSTGRPKGVMVPHRGVIRLTTAADYIELDETAVTLHMSSISFDASTFEIWGALLCGGTVALPPSGLPDARMIRHCIETFGVNELFVTTSLFNTLVEEDVQAFSGLRNLLTGGEAASVSHFVKASAALSDTRIVHVYGPTECTTFATHYSVPADLQDGMPVPIGTPISNTTCFVLDELLQDVPPGGTGELYLAGDGLANGYAAQETLTAERFIALPFHGNERAYKTGDIVRVQEDGNLVFIGRRDNQVKIRGFRIELEEVELAVNRTTEVKRAVAVLHQAADGSKGLAVYAIPSTPDVTAARLRAALRAHLPQAMLPRWIVLVSNLPLGATGKIDRSQLPDPVATDGAVRLTQPQSDTERQLLQLWQDVLGIAEVDRDTNFFDLGGDSIRAIQLAARAAANGVQFEATDLFQFQTISELALAIENRDAGNRTRPEPDARHDPNEMAQADLDAMLSELSL